jgi:hypothetical protein
MIECTKAVPAQSVTLQVIGYSYEKHAGIGSAACKLRDGSRAVR